jgi:hypothetical protein
LLAKYESTAYSTEPLTAFSQDNVYAATAAGVDYSAQFEAYQQAAAANQRAQAGLMGLDYSAVVQPTTTDTVSMLQASAPKPDSQGPASLFKANGYQDATQFLAQPQMPTFTRMGGPSFEVDERYQVANTNPEVSYVTADTASVYSTNTDANSYPVSLPVSLDGTGR